MGPGDNRDGRIMQDNTHSTEGLLGLLLEVIIIYLLFVFHFSRVNRRGCLLVDSMLRVLHPLNRAGVLAQS